MDGNSRCKRCGAELTGQAPDGLCGNCLLRLALEPSADEAPARSSLGKVRYFGDYELLEEIARGGMGVVYRARQVSLNRQVALKMILGGDLASMSFVQRFKTEAEAAASLDYPHIVPIYEIGEHEGQHYFSMRFLEGGTLTQAITQEKFGPRRAAEFMVTVARAVHHAHQRGVLHRDLKPGNILLDGNGEPHVTDFGLAKLLEADTDLTRTDAALGTPSYMSPEQASGQARQLTTAADIYSLGAILYELLTGQPPFKAGSAVETMRQVVEKSPEPPRTLNPQVDLDLETICLKCLEKDPARRYASANGLANDLERWVRHEPISARPVSTSEHVWKWLHRRPPIFYAMASAIVVCLAGGLAGILWQWQRAEQNATGEKRQRKRAEQNEQLALISEEAAQRAERDTRQRLYAADMLATQQALRDGNLGQAREYLRNHLPDSGHADLRGFEWRYYWDQSEGNQLHTFNGHSNTVYCVAFSPDGRWLASGGWDEQVFIWDVRERSRLASFQPGGGRVYSIAFHSAGDLMAVGTLSEVSLWRLADVRHPELLKQRPAHDARVAFLPNSSRLVIGQNSSIYGYSYEPGFAEIWDYERPETVRKLASAGGRIALSADGTVLFTGVRSNSIQRLDLISGETARVNFAWPLRNIGCSPGGRWLITNSGEDDNRAQLWDGVSLRPIRTLIQHREKADIWGVAFSPDNRLAATTHSDQLIRIWTLDSPSVPPIVLRGHGREVWAACSSPDGTLLATGSADETVRLWDLQVAAQPTVLTNVDFDQWEEGPALSPDGNLLAIGGVGATVELWSLDSMRLIEVLTNTTHALRFSRDARKLVTLDDTVTLKVWDLATRAPEATIPLSNVTTRQKAFALSPNGTFLVGATTGFVTVWNVTTKQERRFQAHQGRVYAVTFFPDGRRFVTGGSDRVARIWNLETLQKEDEFGGQKDDIFGVAISADGRLLANASIDGTVKVWNVADRRELWTLTGHKRGVLDAAFNEDGKTLATCSDDGSVRVWNLATGREVGRWQDTHQMTFAVFSPDGSRLVIVCNARTARILNGPATTPLSHSPVR